MLVDRQTINCAFAFSCKKIALFELADPMHRKIFTQLFLQGAARLGALQVPKRQLCRNLTSIGRMVFESVMTLIIMYAAEHVLRQACYRNAELRPNLVKLL